MFLLIVDLRVDDEALGLGDGEASTTLVVAEILGNFVGGPDG
jgi:hypothetical protein